MWQDNVRIIITSSVAKGEIHGYYISFFYFVKYTIILRHTYDLTLLYRDIIFKIDGVLKEHVKHSRGFIFKYKLLLSV
jgi:hypothetical protein